MKILRISKGKGYFRSKVDGEWLEIDQIDKDGLLMLLDLFLEREVEIDDSTGVEIANQAQRIIYNRIVRKLHGLQESKSKFRDECDRLYLKELKKYSEPGASSREKYQEESS